MSIVRFPHPALEQVAEAVPHGESCGDLVAQMLAAMTAEGGIGLAAPQLGVLKRVIVVAVPVFDFQGRRVATVKHTLINPEIIWTGGSLVMGWEGCLSFPAPEEGHGKYRQVLIPRYPRITVRGYTLKWEAVKISAKNLVARALQHEIDHLNGRNLATYARMAKEIEDARKAAEAPPVVLTQGELPTGGVSVTETKIHEDMLLVSSVPVATADPVAN